MDRTGEPFEHRGSFMRQRSTAFPPNESELRFDHIRFGDGGPKITAWRLINTVVLTTLTIRKIQVWLFEGNPSVDAGEMILWLIWGLMCVYSVYSG